MIAKVIAHGRNREEAARRLACALEDEPLFGLPTNQGFLATLLRSDVFSEAALATNSLDAWMEQKAALFDRPAPSDEIWALAAALYAERGSAGEWFWPGNAFDFSLDLDCGERRRRLRYSRRRDARIAVSFEGGMAEVTLVRAEPPDIVFEASGVRRRAIALWSGTALHLSVGGVSFAFEEAKGHGAEDDAAAGGAITAPVAGLLIKVLAEAGQTVEAGQTLALIEAMKMETRVAAVCAGRVIAVHAEAGAQVANASLLFEIEKLEASADV